MQDTYIYPAVFTSDEDGVAVKFPDLPGCLTCADNEQEAVFARRKSEVRTKSWTLNQEEELSPHPQSTF